MAGIDPDDVVSRPPGGRCRLVRLNVRYGSKPDIRDRAIGRRRLSQPLFRDYLAGAAKLGWEVFQLRQAVPHG